MEALRTVHRLGDLFEEPVVVEHVRVADAITAFGKQDGWDDVFVQCATGWPVFNGGVVINALLDNPKNAFVLQSGDSTCQNPGWILQPGTHLCKGYNTDFLIRKSCDGFGFFRVKEGYCFILHGLFIRKRNRE